MSKSSKSPQSIGGLVRSQVRLFERLSGSRDLPLLQELVRENEGLRQLVKELRSDGEKLLRQQEEELRKLYERKLVDLKAKCKQEVMKVVESQKSTLKRSYDDRLHTVEKLKEREIVALQRKLAQSNEQLVTRSRDSLKLNPAKQLDLKPEAMELRFRIKALEEQLMLCSEREKLKDEEIKRLSEIHQKNMAIVTRDYKKHINLLLEELRAKDKQVAKLEGNLKSTESRIPILNNPNDPSNSRTSEMSPGRGLGFATRFHTNVVPKDELEKERQKWELRIAELESQIDKLRNDLANAEMEKKPLIAQINALESTKQSATENQEILEEFVKSLQTEKEMLIAKVSDLQEDNLKLTSGNLSKADLLQMQISGSSHTVQQMKELLSQSLDEMERLKQQNTEFGKTVAALKQAALEKDRKIDLLQNKLKRMKRNKNSDPYVDEDNISNPTEMCQSATSLTSLDTIVEDWEEFAKEEIEENYRHLTREHLELKRAFALLNRNLTRDPQRLLHREKELEKQLKQAATRIGELEKLLKGNAIAIPDNNWTSEKFRYVNLIKNLQHRLMELEEFQEKLYQDLQESREQNELLEFQILEMEHSDRSESNDQQSSSQMEIRKKCDRSVSTSDDEAFFSNDEPTDCEEKFRPLNAEEIKVRFALLKHKKGLTHEEKFIVTQVRDLLENLQAQHGNCQNQLMEYELQLRQSDAQIRQIEQKFQTELERVKSDKFRIDESQFEQQLSETVEKLSRAEEELGKMRKSLEESSKEVAKLSYMLNATEESELKCKGTIGELRKQLESLTQARNAELNILEDKLKLHSSDLEKAQNQIELLNDQLAQTQNSKLTLADKLAEVQNQLELATAEQSKLAEENSISTQNQLEVVKHNEEKFALLQAELQSVLTSKIALETQLQSASSTDKTSLEEKNVLVDQLDRKYQDMRVKFKESLKIIKEYELTDAKYQQKLKQLIERNKQVQSDLNESELKLKRFQSEIESKNEEISQLKSVQIVPVDHNDDFNLEMAAKIQEKDAKIQQLQAYNDQIETQFQVQLSTVNFLKEQLILSQTRLKQSEVSLETLKVEAEDLRTQYDQICTKLEKQNSTQKDFNSEISTEISELCASLQQYQNEVELKGKTVEELRSHLAKAHLALGMSSRLECCANDTTTKSDYIASVEENLKEFQWEIDSIIQTFVTAEHSEYQERLGLLAESCVSLQTAIIEKIAELDRRVAQIKSSLAKVQRQEIAPESNLQSTKTDLNSRLDKAQMESSALQSINTRLNRISTLVERLKSGETAKKEEIPPDEPSLRQELTLNFSTDNKPEPTQRKTDAILHELLAQLKQTVTSSKCTSTSEEGWKVLELIERKIMDLSSEGYRSSSPLEHSGTESEMFDKSPMLPRCDQIFCSTPDSSRPQGQLLQSTSELDHSSHEEDSLSDSTVSVIRRERNKKANRKLLKRRVTMHTSGSSVTLDPPSNLSVVGQLDEKTLIISWCPPNTSEIDGGYKIYLEDQLCHTINDVECRSAVVRLNQSKKQSDRTDVKIVVVRFDPYGSESNAAVLHYSRIDATFETEKIELATGPMLNLGTVALEEDSSEV